MNFVSTTQSRNHCGLSVDMRSRCRERNLGLKLLISRTADPLDIVVNRWRREGECQKHGAAVHTQITRANFFPKLDCYSQDSIESESTDEWWRKYNINHWRSLCELTLSFRCIDTVPHSKCYQRSAPPATILYVALVPPQPPCTWLSSRESCLS